MINNSKIFALIIGGAGPTSLTGGIEAQRLNEKVLIIESDTQVG